MQIILMVFIAALELTRELQADFLYQKTTLIKWRKSAGSPMGIRTPVYSVRGSRPGPG